MFIHVGLLKSGNRKTEGLHERVLNILPGELGKYLLVPGVSREYGLTGNPTELKLKLVTRRKSDHARTADTVLYCTARAVLSEKKVETTTSLSWGYMRGIQKWILKKEKKIV